MRSRKKNTNVNTIMNIVKIKNNKQCYQNDTKMKRKTNKISKNNVNSKLEIS